MDLQTFSTIAGLISLGVTIIGAFYVVRSGVGKTTSDAQQSAISALQTELTTLRGRVADTEKENIRLEQTIQTICSALKLRGMIITIQGEMINIQDKATGGSTTTRIHGSIHSTPQDDN